jgi:hypothetical protein
MLIFLSKQVACQQGSRLSWFRASRRGSWPNEEKEGIILFLV